MKVDMPLSKGTKPKTEKGLLDDVDDDDGL